MKKRLPKLSNFKGENLLSPCTIYILNGVLNSLKEEDSEKPKTNRNN